MSDFAWTGILLSAFFSTFAIVGYIVMALPYFDNAPYLVDLKKHPNRAVISGLGLFVIFFAVYFLAAQTLDQDSAGPLLLFAALIVGLPLGLLLGSETWDRHDARGMNRVPGLQAVLVATGIGLAELLGFSLFFMAVLRLT